MFAMKVQYMKSVFSFLVTAKNLTRCTFHRRRYKNDFLAIIFMMEKLISITIRNSMQYREIEKGILFVRIQITFEFNFNYLSIQSGEFIVLHFYTRFS